MIKILPPFISAGGVRMINSLYYGTLNLSEEAEKN